MQDAETLVFDLDGTLVDTLPDLMEALNSTLVAHGHREVRAAQVTARLHEGLEGMLEAALEHNAGGAPPGRDMLLADLEARYEKEISIRSRPYPGVGDVITDLLARGVRLAVCTNKPERLSELLLEDLGLAGFFRAIVGADTCDVRKPHREPLLHAVAKAGGWLGNACLVGDSQVDLDCAQAAGIPCILFMRGYGGDAADTSMAAATFDRWSAFPVALDAMRARRTAAVTNP